MAEDLDAGIRPTAPYHMIAIKKDLQQFAKTKSWEKKRNCTFFKVERRIRELHPKQFKHELLSLGLYDRSSHDSDTPKTTGDVFRLALVCAFINDLGKTTDEWENICKKVVPSPESTQELYRGVPDDLLTREVQSVLTLDAIFLACFLNQFPGFADEFPSVGMTLETESMFVINILYEDVMKLENQIPLPLIRNVFSLAMECGKLLKLKFPQPVEVENRDASVETAGHGNEILGLPNQMLFAFCASVVREYHPFIPGFKPFVNPVEFRNVAFHRHDHLLDCLYAGMYWGLQHHSKVETVPRDFIRHWVKWFPSNKQERLLPGIRNWMNSFRQNKQGTLLPAASANRRQNVNPDPEGVKALPSATQLLNAGIEIHGRQGGFNDVIFHRHLIGDKAILYLPRINFLGDNCEQIWRNLAAYEDEGRIYAEFKAYLVVMDDLIDTERDVAVLKGGQHPVIIENGLGSDKAIADLFNSMLKECYIERSPKWEKLTRDVHDFYIDDRRRNRVEFWQTYCGKWWLAASVVAASVLLVLALVQTIYSMLSYYHN